MDRGSATQIEDHHAAIGRALDQADSIRIPSEGQPGWKPTTIEQLRWLNREVINGRVRVEYRPIESLGSWFAASDCWHPTLYDYRIAFVGGH